MKLRYYVCEQVFLGLTHCCVGQTSYHWYSSAPGDPETLQQKAAVWPSLRTLLSGLLNTCSFSEKYKHDHKVILGCCSSVRVHPISPCTCSFQLDAKDRDSLTTVGHSGAQRGMTLQDEGQGGVAIGADTRDPEMPVVVGNCEEFP